MGSERDTSSVRRLYQSVHKHENIQAAYSSEGVKTKFRKTFAACFFPAGTISGKS
ncbi:MAG: hypothetical protein ACREDM_16750 [Methylocella sp.]